MVLATKRSWISDKEIDEFDHITGDQIRSMTDLRKLKKLERYMREEGFPQTAEAAYETIIKMGGRVVRHGDRENNIEEYDEEFEGFLKDFDSWKDTMKSADDKLRQLQRGKIFKTKEQDDSVLATCRRSMRPLDDTDKSLVKKDDAAKKKDIRSGRDYYQRWDEYAAKCEKENFDKEIECKKDEKININKERKSIASKSQTERGWLAIREREKGNGLFKAREYIASLDAYSLSIELLPNSATTFGNRAAVQLKLNRWDDAIADCTKALEYEPKHVKALLRRGMAYLEIGKPDAALKDLSTVSDLDPSCKEATNLKEKAERAVCKKREDEAKLEASGKRIQIEDIEGKVEVQSQSSSALLGIEKEKEKGNQIPSLQTRVNRVQRAPQHISTKESVPENELRVISERKLPPKHEDTYIPMRTGPMVIEEIVDKTCDSSESAAPCGAENDSAGMSNPRQQAEKERIMGNERFKAQDYCAAIKCYNKSLSLNPGVATTFANRALCYLKMRDWNTAISDCSQAITIDSGNAKAYYRRAMAYEGLGDLRGALKDLQAALPLQPDDSQISDKLRAIKRKLRVTFVREEEVDKVTTRSPSMHEIKTQFAYSGPTPTPQPSQREDRLAAPQNTIQLPPLTTVPEKPKTAIEFQRSCERLQGQTELLRKFIGGIHIDEYPRIFKENLSVEVLRIILKSLQAAFMPHDPAGTMAVLGGLVKVKRFGLILKLLSPSEKNTFLSIFDWLRDSCGAPFDRAQELKALFS